MAVDDSYTKALLHFNGVDASATFTDESGKTWTPAGDAQLDTAQKKFGTASGLFDGTADCINTPHHADFNFADADFTIDFWVRSTQTTQYATLVCKTPASFSTGMWSLMTSHTSAGDVAFFANEYSTLSPLLLTAGSLFNTGDWVHVALVRYGNDWALYVGGVSSATRTTATTISDLSAAIYVGADEQYGRNFNGHIDELRISKGIARWTANFTPPTTEYGVGITLDGAIAISPSIYGTVHAYPAITSSIVIAPCMSGTLMRGKPGDIYESNILIAPLISGTILEEPPPQLNAPITITPIISGTVSYGWKATIGVSRPMRTFKGKGIVSATGTLNITRPSRMVALVGYDDPLGILNVTRPARSFYATVLTGATGLLEVTRPSRLFNGTVRHNETAILDITLPRRSISLAGAAGAAGTLNVSIPIRRLSFSGILSAGGVLSITRPMRQVLLRTLPTTYSCMVMNLKNKGLTEYSNYLFNSMCRFNGVHLGATSTGIFNLDSGSTDAGTIINWNFRTGYLDMVEQGVKKKVKQAWFSYKSSGDIMLTVIQPDGENYEYDLTGYEVYETGLRVKFGKGFRSRYLAFDVSNIDGSSITLDALKLQFDKVLKER
jgi:hypothetical protein